MFGIIKKIFIGLLTGIVSASNHTKFVSLSNQKCMTQPTLISLHSNEYSQDFHYYPFDVKLDRCVGSFNTLNDLCNKVCFPNKTENLNLRKNIMFGKITLCNCENQKYLASIMDDSAIISDEVMKTYYEETKIVPINFNEKNITCKTQISIFYLHFY